MEERYDVVVVGAGFAGLTAAYELRDLRVLVLEASSHVSARSRHAEVAGLRVTVGGEDWADRVAASYERRLIEALGVAMEPMHGRDALLWGGEVIQASCADELFDALPFGEHARESFAATYARVAEATATLKDPERGPELAHELVRRRASEWLGEVHPEVLDFYARLFRSEYALALVDSPALFFLNSMPPFGGRGFDALAAYETPEGGMPEVIDALVAGLSSAPVTDAAVVEVRETPDGARVAFLHGGRERVVTAGHVIVATPPWVAAGIVRELPAWKTAALRSVRPQPAVEVNVVVDGGAEAPWGDLRLGYGIDGPIGLVLAAQTDRGLRPGSAAGEAPAVMNLMSFGPAAEPYMELTEHQVGEAFVRELRALFPGVEGRILGFHVQKWPSGVSCAEFGYERFVPDLLRPVGGIHFAGDWVGFDVADVEGGFAGTNYTGMVGVHVAMRSGVRAAAMVRGSRDSNCDPTIVCNLVD